MSLNKPLVLEIEQESLDNQAFRNVIATSKDAQLVLMSLLPGEDIGNERHPVTQFIRIEEGKGLSILNNKDKYDIKAGDAIFIPPQTYHNIINTSKTEDLKLYTVYAAPLHNPDVYQFNKEDKED